MLHLCGIHVTYNFIKYFLSDVTILDAVCIRNLQISMLTGLSKVDGIILWLMLIWLCEHDSYVVLLIKQLIVIHIFSIKQSVNPSFCMHAYVYSACSRLFLSISCQPLWPSLLGLLTCPLGLVRDLEYFSFSQDVPRGMRSLVPALSACGSVFASVTQAPWGGRTFKPLNTAWGKRGSAFVRPYPRLG